MSVLYVVTDESISSRTGLVRSFSSVAAAEKFIANVYLKYIPLDNIEHSLDEFGRRTWHVRGPPSSTIFIRTVDNEREDPKK